MPHAPIAPSAVTAAVLAGGAGSRLGGRDKGLEALAGRPLIAHVTKALAPQVAAILICANRNAPRYAAFGRVVADAPPAQAGEFAGPLAGIAAALAACATPWLVTVPVDCPTPPRDLVARLAAAIGTAPAAVAHTDGQAQPLFALYARTAAALAAAALARDAAVWRWQQEIGAAAVDFSAQRRAFDNLNTADEFARWEREHG